MATNASDDDLASRATGQGGSEPAGPTRAGGSPGSQTSPDRAGSPGSTGSVEPVGSPAQVEPPAPAGSPERVLQAATASKGVARWIPLVGTLAHYRRGWLRPDLIAGLSLWALVVPQALAYAQLAGLPAVVGLYTALAGMAVYAVLGTTRFLTVGPESTVALIVADALIPLANVGSDRYLALTALLAALTGVFLLMGAVLRAGVIVRFMSAPVLVGYLAGAGIVIIISQLSKALGFTVDKTYPTAVEGLIRGLGRTNWWAVILAVATIALVVALRHWVPRLPGALIALALATAAVYFTGLKDEGLSVVGAIPAGLVAPGTGWGELRWGDVWSLAPTALSIAVFVFATSALTAKATDPEQKDYAAGSEFVALGATSIASAALGGYPTNSSDTRSFFLAQSGARTQLANLVTAALVLVTLLALTPLFADLPLAALAGVILVTALRLVDVRALRRLARLRTSDFVLATITLVGVVVTGPLQGIVVGVIASLLDVVRRTVVPRTSELARVPGEVGAWRDAANIDDPGTVPGVVVYRFDAPLFFANADLLRDQILALVDAQHTPARAVVLSAEGIGDLDVTGAEVVGRLVDDLAERGVRLYVARLRTPVRTLLESTGVMDRIGADALFLRIDDAVTAAGALEVSTAGPDGPVLPEAAVPPAPGAGTGSRGTGAGGVGTGEPGSAAGRPGTGSATIGAPGKGTGTGEAGPGGGGHRGAAGAGRPKPHRRRDPELTLAENLTQDLPDEPAAPTRPVAPEPTRPE